MISRFWDELSKEHLRDLERFGYADIKRRQAFRYFNWNWRWHTLRKSEQWRFLCKNASLSKFVRCTLTPPVLSDRQWAGVPLGRADRILYTIAVRVLWEYAASKDRIGVLKLEEPRIGNPVPVLWKRRLISQDLANTSLEVNAFARMLAERAPRRILEIGAGYGRTAYVLMSLFKEASYTIVDIEPALSISKWYLENLFPGRELRFVSAENAATELRLVREPYDLAVSISSLQEMTLPQIAEYLALIDETVSNGLVYLKQWKNWYNRKDHVHVRFADYPIPSRWHLCFTEPAAVQTGFDQSCWKLPELSRR